MFLPSCALYLIRSELYCTFHSLQVMWCVFTKLCHLLNTVHCTVHVILSWVCCVFLPSCVIYLIRSALYCTYHPLQGMWCVFTKLCHLLNTVHCTVHVILSRVCCMPGDLHCGVRGDPPPPRLPRRQDAEQGERS